MKRIFSDISQSMVADCTTNIVARNQITFPSATSASLDETTEVGYWTIQTQPLACAQLPTHLILTLDVSGSMNEFVGTSSLTRLDYLKRCFRNIIALLRKQTAATATATATTAATATATATATAAPVCHVTV